MTVLHRKLARDLWRIRAQALAIAAVVAVGVMMQVMMTGLVVTLGETRDAYFDRYRLADVFAPVTRAPVGVMDRVAAIPGVLASEGRVAGLGRIDVADSDRPVQARVLSLPRVPDGLNGILLTAGRLPVAGGGDEIVLLDSFAQARRIALGDRLVVTIEGARQRLRVVGLARAPEFMFMPAPGEFFPADDRFAVIWMDPEAAAAALDLRGAFNEALVLTSRDRPPQAVLADLDRLLGPHGGGAGYLQDQQTSARFVGEELTQLRRSSRFLPPVFLGVAAFLLNVTIARIIQAERREIGLLKAFGHTGAEIAGHYLEMALVIALVGAALGSALGVMAGHGLVQVYMMFYKFPFLVFSLGPGPFAAAIAFSVVAAASGALLALRGLFRLTPAEAMRPPAPPDFARAGNGALARVAGLLDQPGRMILRQLTRQPFRSLGTIVGISFGLGLNMAMLMIYAGFDHTMAVTFGFADRSTATVAFVRPVAQAAAHDIRNRPGVIVAEGRREVPVLFRNGLATHRGALTGLPPDARLNRPLDKGLNPIPLPVEGVVLSRGLAEVLGIKPGEMLRVEVTEGRRQPLWLPVAGVSDTLLGAPAYMRLDSLGRAIREPDRINSLALRLDPARAGALMDDLRAMPMVAGVSFKSDSWREFRRIADEGAGRMRFVLGAIAFVLSFGIVYNAARISFSERALELASLRVMGFTRAEVMFLLAGEIAVLVMLALPLGTALGWQAAQGIALAFSNELYQVSARFQPHSVAMAVLVVLGSMTVSVAMLRRALDRMNMVEALKARE